MCIQFIIQTPIAQLFMGFVVKIQMEIIIAKTWIILCSLLNYLICLQKKFFRSLINQKARRESVITDAILKVIISKMSNIVIITKCNNIIVSVLFAFNLSTSSSSSSILCSPFSVISGRDNLSRVGNGHKL